MCGVKVGILGTDPTIVINGVSAGQFSRKKVDLPTGEHLSGTAGMMISDAPS